MNQTKNTHTPAVSIRPASAEDGADVRRLAGLDSSVVPASPLLIATVDGVPAAAISLADGHVVADPFQPTAALVALLRMRADHLHGPARSPGRARLRHGLTLRGRRAVA